MSTRSIHATETIQACLLGVALLLIGAGLLMGDIVIERSILGGGLLVLAGGCYLASALLRFRRGVQPRKQTRV